MNSVSESSVAVGAGTQVRKLVGTVDGRSWEVENSGEADRVSAEDVGGGHN